jgi:peroxiredoxin
MSLQEELDRFRREFLAKVPAEVPATMARADAELAVQQVTRSALKAGDTAPDFTLPDAAGRPVSLYETLGRGPVILIFYRGGWCPYCNLQLRAYQRLLPSIHEAGGQLLAVSPQSPDASLSTRERNELAYPVLSDVRNEATRAFGVLYTLPDYLRRLYTELGHGLEGINASREPVLPVPATHVIDPSRRIVASHVEIDYRTRMEPQAALDALKRVKGAVVV